MTCPAGGTLSRTGTLPHWTRGGALGFTHAPSLTLTYTAPATLPSCIVIPTDVVRVEARGFTRDLLFRVSCGASPSDPVETPSLSPPGGTTIDTGGSSLPVRVGAFTGTAGATIRMTTDGSDPGPASPERSRVDLSNNLTTTEQTVVRARAFHPEREPSGVAQETYVVKASTPVLSPPAATYAGPQSVAITTATPGATLRYSLDGTPPTASSFLYAGPVAVSCGQTLTAAAFKDRVARSEPAGGTYLCSPPPACADLVGVFLALFTVESDPGGHAPFVNLESAVLTAAVNGSTLSVSGDHPSTVAGAGPLDTSSCTGSATGLGTIAGFPNVRCDYEGVKLAEGALTGTYTCGVGGGLPGNQPIRYGFTGTRQGP